MTLEGIAQEFTCEGGEVERITAEPLEFSTEAGWEIIPAGFRFRFRAPRWFRLSDTEQTACVLYEWHKTTRNRTRWAAVRILRRNLINSTGRIKAEALAIIVPVFWRMFCK